MALTRWSVPRTLAPWLGWLGLGMILVTGIAVDARATFPGPSALLPIGGAVLVILAGVPRHETNEGGAQQHTRPAGVARLLAWRPVALAGGYAYEFYLWHWVVLVFALSVTGRTSLGWLAGSTVLLASALVAWLARKVTDIVTGSGASRATPDGSQQPGPSRWAIRGRRALVAVVVTATAAAMVAPATWLTYRSLNPWTGVTDLDVSTHPGALSLLDPGKWPDVPGQGLIPSAFDAAHDWPTMDRENCEEADLYDPEVYLCVMGDPAAQRSVALIGGSHTVSFALPIEAAAKEAGIRIDGYFKQGCPLSNWDEVDPTDQHQASCAEWSQSVIARVLDSDAIGAITTGTRPGFEREDWDEGDFVPDEYLNAWGQLIDGGVGVAAIRDTPWFDKNIRECVEVNGPESLECVGDRQAMLGPDVLTDALDDDLFTPLDLTDAICDETTCRPVVGNVLVYIDSNHITATYGRTMAPAVAEALKSVPWWP